MESDSDEDEDFLSADEGDEGLRVNIPSISKSYEKVPEKDIPCASINDEVPVDIQENTVDVNCPLLEGSIDNTSSKISAVCDAPKVIESEVIEKDLSHPDELTSENISLSIVKDNKMDADDSHASDTITSPDVCNNGISKEEEILDSDDTCDDVGEVKVSNSTVENNEELSHNCTVEKNEEQSLNYTIEKNEEQSQDITIEKNDERSQNDTVAAGKDEEQSHRNEITVESNEEELHKHNTNVDAVNVVDKKAGDNHEDKVTTSDTSTKNVDEIDNQTVISELEDTPVKETNEGCCSEDISNTLKGDENVILNPTKDNQVEESSEKPDFLIPEECKVENKSTDALIEETTHGESISENDENEKNNDENDDNDWDSWTVVEKDLFADLKNGIPATTRHLNKVIGNNLTTEGENDPDIGGTDNENAWGWDSWADNFISQATTKVSSLVETVEGQLGIPAPTQLAQTIAVEDTDPTDLTQGIAVGDNQTVKNEEKKLVKDIANVEDCQQKENASSWFSSFVPVASLTNIVQSTGQDLVTSGIDALEFIGKSTVNYLSEGDPGLRNKRKNLFNKKGATLSAILQEAKSKSESKGMAGSPMQGEDPKKLNDMLEKFQSIAHLDALEMLSGECENKLERILNVQSEAAKDESIQTLTAIKESFDMDETEGSNLEDHDFKKELFATTKRLKIKVTCSKLLNTWSKLQDKTNDLSNFDDSEKCFEGCISSLAEFVSRCIEYHRKVADMLILTDMQAKQLAVERAAILKSVSEMFQYEISSLSNKFANHLADDGGDTKTSDFITDIYLESTNCSSLIQDSHMLLLPILQCSAVK